jgi:hypothetical protein|tara:strand:- start:3892 stop:4047 length:156 start_codon:yes stop_codon:yes gene_type:complete
MKKYTIHFSGKKTIFASDLDNAVASAKNDIGYTHPSLNLKVKSVEFTLEEE